MKKKIPRCYKEKRGTFHSIQKDVRNARPVCLIIASSASVSELHPLEKYGGKAVQKVCTKVEYINLCCLKGHKVLVMGPPDYEKPCEEDLPAIHGSLSKTVQAIMDREQARLWRKQQAHIADQELFNRFSQVDVVFK